MGLTNVDAAAGHLPRRHRPIRSRGRRFRLVHIDVDVYQSAKDVFEWAWPRLVGGRGRRLRRLRVSGLPGRHRVRRRAARPAGPAGRCTTSTATGSSSSDRRGRSRARDARPVASHHRRRRGLHRQPLHRSRCWPTRRPSASRCTTISPPAGVALRRARSDDPRLRVVRGDANDLRGAARRRWTATTSSSTWPRIPTSRAR